MPELPEVETILRGVLKFTKHKFVGKVKISSLSSFLGPKELIEGQKIIGIRRFGKALIFDFENGVSMMVHLRMTGQLIYRNLGTESGKDFVKVILKRNCSTRMVFRADIPAKVFMEVYRISKREWSLKFVIKLRPAN